MILHLYSVFYRRNVFCEFYGYINSGESLANRIKPEGRKARFVILDQTYWRVFYNVHTVVNKTAQNHCFIKNIMVKKS